MTKKSHVCAIFSALAHETRLNAFRMLIAAEPEGVPSGVLAARLGVLANTMSANLAVLTEAGLATAHRDGKIVRYRARFPKIQELVDFLQEECSGRSATDLSDLGVAADRRVECAPATHERDDHLPPLHN